MATVEQGVSLLPESIRESLTPGKEEIISVYPLELTLDVPHAGVTFTYVHPPAQRDKKIVLQHNPERTTAYPPKSAIPFSYKEEDTKMGEGYTRIIVYDTYQLTRDWTQDAEVLLKKDIPATIVVKDLVRCWTSGRVTESASGGPGIAVFDPKLRLEEQLGRIREHQKRYFRELIFQADRYFETKQWLNITNLHRAAAQELGVEGSPWFNPISGTGVKNCPACQNSMAHLAIVCPKCNSNIIEFAKKMHALGVKVEDPVLTLYKVEMDKPEKPEKR